jgi:Adenylate and Guanylate cyclase catalytic domain
VRAGPELITAVAALKTHTSLQTRVGIATGLVVVGDLIGSGEAQERGIVGETPNLAARLQGIAEPNTVIIAESTQRLLGNLFEFENLGPRDQAAAIVNRWRPEIDRMLVQPFEQGLRRGGRPLLGAADEIDEAVARALRRRFRMKPRHIRF